MTTPTVSEALARYARDLDEAHTRFVRSHLAARGDMCERHDLSSPVAHLSCAVRNRELGARSLEQQAGQEIATNVIRIDDYFERALSA
jgi:hypothetical protein